MIFSELLVQMAISIFRPNKSTIVLLLGALLTSTANSAEQSPEAEALSNLKHITQVSEEPCGYYVDPLAKCFTLEIEQPVDHREDGGETFTQALRIIHRSFDAPMTLATRGYYSFGGFYPGEPTKLLQANMIEVEHRYFGDSSPAAPLDWSKLNIRQAATDMHRIVESLRNLYTGKWISFGTSKGGMTATYHRRFYPNDIDGTIAYVAPLSFSRADKRFDTFLQQVGGDAKAQCRQDLIDFQRYVLQADLSSALETYLSDKNLNLDPGRWNGGAQQLLESLAAEFTFAFWQTYGYTVADSYGYTVADCTSIPKDGRRNNQIMIPPDFISYIDNIVGIAGFVDGVYDSYYWQAMTELGYGSLNLEPIKDLLAYTPEDYTTILTPIGVHVPRHRPHVMKKMSKWAKKDARNIMYIYGEIDPWSAGAYPLSDRGKHRDVHRFIVKGDAGDHSSNIDKLDDADREQAIRILNRWAGLDSVEPRKKSKRDARRGLKRDLHWNPKGDARRGLNIRTKGTLGQLHP